MSQAYNPMLPALRIRTEPLRAAVDEVFDQWRAIMRDALTAAGRSETDAADLAELCIAGLEGAIVLARVDRASDPIDRVERVLHCLLTTPAPRCVGVGD